MIIAVAQQANMYYVSNRMKNITKYSLYRDSKHDTDQPDSS